ncbi:MAG: hypothetical protein ACNYPH_00910 [Gammaproteobacteria bacterium WSBS_2016_MAG_OTU1]
MSPVEFMLRVIGAFAILIFLVLFWAVVPYLQGVHLPNSPAEFEAPLLTIIFGTTQPKLVTVSLLLFSRFCFGMAAAAFVLLPALRFFVDADFRPLARAAVIVFFGSSTVAFFAAILAHLVFYA